MACVTIIVVSQGYWILMILLQFSVRFLVGLRYHDQCFVYSFVRSSYIGIPRTFFKLFSLHLSDPLSRRANRIELGRLAQGGVSPPFFRDQHYITDTPALVQVGKCLEWRETARTEVGFL